LRYLHCVILERKKKLTHLLIIVLLLAGSTLRAEVLKAPDVFINEAFSELDAPKRETLWLSQNLKASILSDVGYQFNQLRVRYWGAEERTAWVLEEIGKEELITMGIIVDQGKIASVGILAYRESRGGEVKYDFFTNQFHGATLVKKKSPYGLSERIDSITGATLSVRAVKKVAKLALFLHELTPYHINGEKE